MKARWVDDIYNAVIKRCGHAVIGKYPFDIATGIKHNDIMVCDQSNFTVKYAQDWTVYEHGDVMVCNLLTR